VPAVAAPLTALPEPLARSLRGYGLSTAGLSVYVHEIGSPTPLLSVAADEPRSPASVMKLLPTLAALEELGPAYQWKTELWGSAPLRDGRLDGDLYIKGYGDPYLVVEHFWRLLRQARQEGLTVIGGDLVLDQSYFGADTESPSDFDGRPYRAYNVLPTALLINFQAVNFRFIPDVASKRLRIVADPWPAHLVLENNVKLVHERCRGGWMSGFGMRAVQKAKQETVIFSGTYDAACGERETFRVVSEPLPYVGGVFKSVWSEMGGRFDGQVRQGEVPPNAQLIADISSPPLADVIRSVNKFSNNVMTRQLLLTLGAQQEAPGTVQKGIDAIRAWMKKRSLDFPELVLENGAGLSRKERISARHLGELLLAGYASPSMPEFLSSFPIAGLDGTMRYRLANTPLAGRVHLKTGSINNVHTIAGYVLDQFNRRTVVVVLHNHPQADTAAADAFQDAVLNWVYRRPPAADNAARAARSPAQ
jgi:D-alanyl-D-alanine carboxypeptidase/D-alanyl-D-alanine-endopeptidase (penicillin-binding protein 4)